MLTAKEEASDGRDILKFHGENQSIYGGNSLFMRKTEATLHDQNVAIKNLETQLEQMTLSLTSRSSNSLLNNTKINPKEHAKVITTKSGVQLVKIHV